MRARARAGGRHRTASGTRRRATRATDHHRLRRPPRQPVRSSPPVQTAPAKKKMTTDTKAKLGCGDLVVVVILIIVIAGAVGGGSNKTAGNGRPAPSPKYKATILNVFASNRQELTVGVKVTNVGNASGTPQCTIQATSPGGADSGFTLVTAKSPIKPGTSSVFTTTVTITHTSATLVQKTGVKVKCTTPL